MMKPLKTLAMAGTVLAASALAMPAMADGPRHKRDRANVDVTVQFGGYTQPNYVHHKQRNYYGKGYHNRGYYGGKGHVQRYTLNRPQVRHSLRNVGYRNIHNIEFRPRRGIYTAYATGFRGRDVLLTVDAYSGRILNVQRFGRPHQKRHRGYYYR